MRIVIACLALGLLAFAPATAEAARHVPPSFFATNWDAEISKTAPPAVQDREWKRMANSGVGSTRAPVEWVTAEPTPGVYDWSKIDRLVQLASTNGIDLLPVVQYAPPWAREREGNFSSPPKDPATYANFMTKLVERYGPGGAYWTEHPDVPKRPLRAWQIWNEPHLPFQWDIKPGDDYAATYGNLLRVAYRAVKKADPNAKVVLAGLANASYTYLKQLYTRGRIHGSFDVAAVHPYTATPAGVVELVRRFRVQMKRFGDQKKQLWVTELSLPASKGKIDSKSNLQTTDKGLAKYIGGSYDALARARTSTATKVERVYQYTWASVYCCEQFRFTGLLSYDNKDTVKAKPAYTAYVRAARRYGALAKPAARRRAAPAAARRQVPVGFFGTMVDGPLLEDPVDLGSESLAMVAAGVESMRFTAVWAHAQPYATWADVPTDMRESFRDEGGIPTDFSRIDRVVATAAARNMSVLPVILYAPQWDAKHPGDDASPPRGTSAYADFAALLVRRYGPSGSFWSEHPGLSAKPIRAWQIWNEPSTTFFWSDQPGAKAYVDLLKAARRSITGADPGAQIVLAGLPNRSWDALQDLYDAGAGGNFDVAAVHPFTLRVSGVLTILRRNRAVMRRNGDAKKPMVVTELSWPTAEGKVKTTYGFEVTEKGQAQRVETALPVLAENRRRLRLAGVYWYTWLTRDRNVDYPFDWAGLSRLSGRTIVRKPAYRALRKTALRIEGCAAKAPDDAAACATS